MEEKLYQWVDRGTKDSTSRFSGRRTVRLLVAILALNVVASLPIAVIWSSVAGIEAAKKADAERKENEELRAGIEKSVRDGTAGEAFQRLFGQDQVPPKKEPHGAAN